MLAASRHAALPSLRVYELLQHILLAVAGLAARADDLGEDLRQLLAAAECGTADTAVVQTCCNRGQTCCNSHDGALGRGPAQVLQGSADG
jgi:hypothetical protein